MKKLLMIVFILVLMGCGLEAKDLGEFYEGDLSHITHVEIMSGETGEMRVIDDKERLQVFLNEVKNVQFIPQENQEKRSGFRYSINLYKGNKKTFGFSVNMVNGHYYDTEPNLFPIVDKWFKREGAKAIN
ncbi:hypothetical protein N780_15980 [Pontibacillus chungwhensis BH030062]|uniref:Lipoprotein n=1 Tax=Pontibacillus chungwhensis BH030062 TaxID=1385513 RepID=A0A0A2UUC1_9BACI|nr:hypothetical protein [Pontibacillus chungwhensis]KGP91852.1 hypothetical protein N780_15980 [Pontibacillus chungwhensis BH030062]